MSFQYVSSMRLPLRRNQATTVDPSAETLSIDGSAQMYLRDPAGNLVEVGCRRRGARGCTWRPRQRANIFVDLSRPGIVLRLDAGGC